MADVQNKRNIRISRCRLEPSFPSYRSNSYQIYWASYTVGWTYAFKLAQTIKKKKRDSAQTRTEVPALEAFYQSRVKPWCCYPLQPPTWPKIQRWHLQWMPMPSLQPLPTHHWYATMPPTTPSPVRGPMKSVESSEYPKTRLDRD